MASRHDWSRFGVSQLQVQILLARRILFATRTDSTSETGQFPKWLRNSFFSCLKYHTIGWTRTVQGVYFVFASGREASSCAKRTKSLRACFKNARVPAARDFGRRQGGEFRASPQRAVRNEPTQSPAKRTAARRVSRRGRSGFVAPRHAGLGPKTGALGFLKQALTQIILSSFLPNLLSGRVRRTGLARSGRPWARRNRCPGTRGSFARCATSTRTRGCLPPRTPP
jgi:hypothetical protein